MTNRENTSDCEHAQTDGRAWKKNEASHKKLSSAYFVCENLIRFVM